MTAQWDDDVHHAIHALVTGERHGYYGDFGSPEVLRKALTSVFVHDGELVDASAAATGAGRSRRAPTATASSSPRRRTTRWATARWATARRNASTRAGVAAEAALVLLSPFSPMLFMGEEWGTRTPWQFFTDHPEPDLAAAVRDGRRREFGGHGWDVLYGGDIEVPDPQDPATFRASILDRTELDDPAHPEHARLRDWYRSLIALRRTVPDLASGDLSATDLVWGGASERRHVTTCPGTAGWCCTAARRAW